MKLCDYGCGQKAKFYFKESKKWCCSKSWNSCIKVRKKRSDTSKKSENRGRFKKGQSGWWKDKSRGIHSKETKTKISIGVKKSENKSKFKFGNIPWNLNKKGYFSEKVLKNLIERMTGDKNPNKTIEARNRKSKLMKRKWEDLSSAYHSESYLKKLSKSLNLKPNKCEVKILNILNESFPGEWEYTGDYSFWINGKNPDFVNFSRKLIIEHFGSFWHKGDDPEERKSFFKKFGYETLVIWEYELSDEEGVSSRIKLFNSEHNTRNHLNCEE